MNIPKTKHSQKLNAVVVAVSALAGLSMLLKPDLMTAFSPGVALGIIAGLSTLSAVLVNYKQNL